MTLARQTISESEQRWSAEARAAEQARRDHQAGKAMITVAGHSANAGECRELLEMLGIDPELHEVRAHS